MNCKYNLDWIYVARVCVRTSARLSNLYQSTNWKICKRHVNGSLWSWLSIISTFPSNFLVCMCLFSSRVCVLLATFLVIQYSPKKKVKEKWTKHRRPTAKESETKCCYGENLIRIRSEISHIFVVIESIEAQSDKTYIESFATHTHSCPALKQSFSFNWLQWLIEMRFPARILGTYSH